VSEKLGLRNETLLEEFERFQKNDRLQSVQKLKTKEGADQDAEERGQERYALASHIFVFKRNKEAEGGEAEHFEKEYARVFEETPEDTLEKLDVAVRERYIFEIEADNKTILEEKTYIEQLLKRITIGELEQRAKQLLNKLKDAEDEADKSSAEALFKEYSRTLSEIENIKQQP
jgi:hypothetical protein